MIPNIPSWPLGSKCWQGASAPISYGKLVVIGEGTYADIILVDASGYSMNSVSFKRLSVVLASFLGVTYILCVLYGLAVPAAYSMHSVWGGLLPGFQWLSWGSFFIGLGEVFLYGVYAAALYVLLSKTLTRTFFRWSLFR